MWFCLLSTLMWMLNEQVADWFVTGLLALDYTIIQRVINICAYIRRTFLRKRMPCLKRVEFGEPENNSLSSQGHLSFQLFGPRRFCLHIPGQSTWWYLPWAWMNMFCKKPEPVHIGLGLGEHDVDRGGSNWQGLGHIRRAPEQLGFKARRFVQKILGGSHDERWWEVWGAGWSLLRRTFHPLLCLWAPGRP